MMMRQWNQSDIFFFSSFCASHVCCHLSEANIDRNNMEILLELWKISAWPFGWTVSGARITVDVDVNLDWMALFYFDVWAGNLDQLIGSANDLFRLCWILDIPLDGEPACLPADFVLGNAILTKLGQFIVSIVSWTEKIITTLRWQRSSSPPFTFFPRTVPNKYLPNFHWMKSSNTIQK